MKKHIICTVTNDLSYDQRMIRICSTLVDAGFDVTLIGRIKRKSIPLIERKFKQHRIRCFFYEGKLFYLEYNIRLFFYLLFTKFDVVNAVDLDTILPAYSIHRLKGKKWIYDAHEYFTEMPEVVRRPKVKKIWKWVERFTVSKIKYAYTVCESLSELFKKEYQKDFEVIRNVPFRFNYEKISQENRIILYQGSLNEGRGLEQMIDAMHEINGAEFWMAGEGDKSDVLRKKVKEEKLGDKVKFLGYLQPEALRESTSKADVGLNLLENKGLNYYYSLANKSFDYIQAEVPSINMDFPEYQKIKEKYEVALLVPDLKKETLVKAINQLLNNKELYQELQDNCRKAREEYIWEKEKEKLIKIYSELITNYE